eukprot:5756924-Pleurochrysis_carterae.AAC.3
MRPRGSRPVARCRDRASIQPRGPDNECCLRHFCCRCLCGAPRGHSAATLAQGCDVGTVPPAALPPAVPSPAARTSSSSRRRHRLGVTSVCASAAETGAVAASSAMDSYIRIWDLERGEQARSCARAAGHRARTSRACCACVLVRAARIGTGRTKSARARAHTLTRKYGSRAHTRT